MAEKAIKLSDAKWRLSKDKLNIHVSLSAKKTLSIPRDMMHLTNAEEIVYEDTDKGLLNETNGVTYIMGYAKGIEFRRAVAQA
jgi:hypothetical protein